MSDLQRYECDFCKNAYNDTPAATHTIDGDEHDLCEECKREFDRLTQFPEHAQGMDYQYHGIYYPKSLAGETVRRHFWLVQEDYNGLAEWCLIDKLLMAFHKDRVSEIEDEWEGGSWGSYHEYSDRAEQDVLEDTEFNRS